MGHGRSAGSFSSRIWDCTTDANELKGFVPHGVLLPRHAPHEPKPLPKAVQQQSTVNPAGQVGAAPAPEGIEKTYTVRAQGRLQTPEEFGRVVVRSNPDGSVVRLQDVARIELGALNYQQRSRKN